MQVRYVRRAAVVVVCGALAVAAGGCGHGNLFEEDLAADLLTTVRKNPVAGQLYHS
ncbi:hypothetical protein ACFXPW_08875 [Streptomyces goshikiensis]|uniref:hypothetical protein n=1 Tax=Streptomyces goshikiensis TaxID=1942 RepID=UPI0036CC3646